MNSVSRESLSIAFRKFLKPEQIIQTPEAMDVYGNDWSQMGIPRPGLVVLPRTTLEVSQILRLCSENKWAVVPSGGRTGLSGGALAANGEVVLSLEKMNQIGTPSALSRSIRVQAGAITKDVHDRCETIGLTWPVDFASKGSSQVGGNLATNAGGLNVIRYGNTRNWVQSIEVVLMNGDVLELNNNLEKNNAGYDLRNLVIGSEGTLAVITAATLRLTPTKSNTDLILLSLRSMKEVAHVFESCHAHKLSLSAFEYMSRDCYETSLKFCSLASPLGDLSPETNAIALIEIHAGDTASWLEHTFSSGQILNGIQAQSPLQAEHLWKIRETIAESVLHGHLVHQHDISVPIDSLVRFSETLEAVYEEHYPHFKVFIFGHIGDGNLHIFVQKPPKMTKEAFEDLCRDSDLKLFRLVQEFKGSTSAEHGIGLWKKPGLLFSRSSTEIALFKGIKQVFDPLNLLNPGKILDS